MQAGISIAYPHYKMILDSLPDTDRDLETVMAGVLKRDVASEEIEALRLVLLTYAGIFQCGNCDHWYSTTRIAASNLVDKELLCFACVNGYV